MRSSRAYIEMGKCDILKNSGYLTIQEMIDANPGNSIIDQALDKAAKASGKRVVLLNRNGTILRDSGERVPQELRELTPVKDYSAEDQYRQIRKGGIVHENSRRWGRAWSLTKEAIKAIENAVIIFGSQRAIELGEKHIKCNQSCLRIIHCGIYLKMQLSSQRRPDAFRSWEICEKRR